MKHEAITKKLWRNLVALFAILIASSNAYATDIADGGSYTINSSWATIVCKGNATLTVKPTQTVTLLDGTQVYFTQTSVTATNGTVTLDFSQCTDLPVLFTQLFRAEKNGKVIFKGAGKMFVGTDAGLGEPYAIAEKVQNKAFGIAAAESTDGFQGVEFVNIALLALPMPEGVSWTVRNGATLGSLAANPFASAGYAGSDKAQLTGKNITLANFDVWMMVTNVFEAGATITVAANRTLHIKSMTLQNTWGVTSNGTDNWRHSQNIVLQDATSRLFTRSGRGAYLDGSISGAGYIETYDNYNANTYFYGPLTFSGPIRCPYLYDSAVAGSTGYSFLPGSVAWTEPKDVLLNYGYLVFGSQLTGEIKIGTFTGHDFVNSVVKMYNSEQDVQIGKLVGKFSMSSDVTKGKISVADAEDGAIIRLPSSSNVKIFSQVPMAKVEVLESGSTRATYYCFNGATISVDDNLEIVSMDVPEGLTLNLPNGASKVALSGGKVKLRDCIAEGVAYVAENASLWLDASVTETVNTFTNVAGVTQKYNNTPLVYEWLDRSQRKQWLVGNYRGFGLFNDKLIPSTVVPSGNGYTGGETSVLPLYRENLLNGLPIFDFSGNSAKTTRAMIFKNKLEVPTQNDFKPAFCIMVYGSHGGGGSALLANTAGDFARASTGSLAVDGLDKPLIADRNNKGFEAWVNGAKVNVKDGNLLSGGWDIVSIDTKGVQVVGLGYASSNTGDGMGSSQYAEVIFFHSVPTEEARESVELYLAEKWGLTGKVAENITKPQLMVTVSGVGEVAVNGDVKLSGSVVDGQISVADGAKVTYDSVSPATQADVAEIEDCVAWFDPSDTARLVMSTGKDSEGNPRALEVSAISNRIAGSSTSVLVGNNPNSATCRCPWLNREKRAYRSGMNWLDYSNHYSGDTMGDYMYFANKTGSSYGDKTFAGSAARMAFIVSDSVRGGGSPIFDAPSEFDASAPNGKGKIKVRYNTTHTTAIWPSGTGAEVTGGKTYLNGDEVNGSTTGFTGAPEVFAFSTTADLNFGFQGYYGNSDSGRKYGEILGESLYFGRELTDDERNAVTSYLMWKWLGKVPAGYAMFGDAELAGSGTITGVTQAALPKLAAGFNGTVELSDASCEFQLTSPDETVGGAIIAPAATLKLPATISLKFNGVTNKLNPGEYVLFDVATLNGAETINLDYTGIPERLRDRLSITKVGGKVCLVFASKGMILLVR